MAKALTPLQKLMIVLVRGYQKWLSPIMGPCCRFTPTCSQFTIEAISCHGAIKGCWFALLRILKCQPLHPGGSDPVPPVKQGREK